MVSEDQPNRRTEAGSMPRSCRGESAMLEVLLTLYITLLANVAIIGTAWAGDVIAREDQASGVNSAAANSEGRIGELNTKDPSVSIFDIRYSPDGTMVAAAFYERESSGNSPAIIVWDRKSQRARYRLYTHERKAWCVVFSPDGRLLATGGGDRAIRLWDVNTGRQLHECKGSAPVFSLAFSLDGRLLASSNGEYVRWWNAKSLKEYAADAVALTASGSGLYMARQVPILACGGIHSDVTLINADSRKVLKRLITGEGDGEIERLALSSDGAILVVQELNGPASAWDTATAHKKADLNSKGGLCAAMSPDDRLLALEREPPGFPPGVIELWETLTWTIAKTIRHNQLGIHQFAFSPDSSEGASAGEDGTAVLWDLTGLRSRKPTDRDDLHQLFDELKCPDANRAYPAIWKLVNQGSRAVELIRREVKLQPPAAAWNAELTKLINDLDSDSFGARETATKLLIDKGPSIVPLLHQRLASKLSPESAARIKGVIERFDRLAPDDLRACRCVAVLEHIGSDEAVRTLRLLANGGPGLLTQHAQRALTRIQDQELRSSGGIDKGYHAK
jgi:WD domain, G-beta repeat